MHALYWNNLNEQILMRIFSIRNLYFEEKIRDNIFTQLCFARTRNIFLEGEKLLGNKNKYILWYENISIQVLENKNPNEIVVAKYYEISFLSTKLILLTDINVRLTVSIL